MESYYGTRKAILTDKGETRVNVPILIVKQIKAKVFDVFLRELKDGSHEVVYKPVEEGANV